MIFDVDLQSVNPGIEPFVTVALLVVNAGVVVTIAVLLAWSKLFQAHYNHTERTRFKCSKKQASMIFRCVKWTDEEEVSLLEERVVYAAAQVKKMYDEGEGYYVGGEYTGTSHGIPIKEFHAAFLDKEIQRYTAHRAFELTEMALENAKATHAANRDSLDGAKRIDYSNPGNRASLQMVGL